MTILSMMTRLMKVSKDFSIKIWTRAYLETSLAGTVEDTIASHTCQSPQTEMKQESKELSSI